MGGSGNTQQQTQASISRQQEMHDRQKQMETIERDIENVHMIYKELNQLVYSRVFGKYWNRTASNSIFWMRK